jgi:hypothetical protein
MTEDSLLLKLKSLANRVIEETTSHISSTEMETIKRTHLTPEFYRFDYEPYGILYSLNLIPKELIKWNPINQAYFISKLLRNLQEYQEVNREIQVRCTDDKVKSLSNLALQNFVSITVSKTYEGTIQETLDDYLFIFVSDFEGKPTKWRCKSWMTGIWLKDEQLEISPELKIRRPEPTDLQEEWVLGDNQLQRAIDWNFFDPLSDSFLSPGSEYGPLPLPSEQVSFERQTLPKLSAIVEFSCQTEYGTALPSLKVFYEVASILDCLTLFDTGSAFPVKIALHPISFVMRPATYLGLAKIPYSRHEKTPVAYEYHSDFYQYPLEKSDIPKLAGLIKTMQALYPERGIQHSLKKESPVFIALWRYQDAFLWSQNAGITGQIASSVMALEALLLKEDELSELSHKLSQRAAALMRFCGFDSIYVYSDVKKSYDIRSKYVHGSVKLLTTDDDSQKRAMRTLTYARNTLLLFLQLKILNNKDKAGLGKEAFIKEIDESLLEENQHSRLSKRISQLTPLFRPAD